MIRLAVIISGSATNIRALLEQTVVGRKLFGKVQVVVIGADRNEANFMLSEEYGIPSFLLEPKQFETRQAWAEALAKKIHEYKPDLVLLSGFMRLLPAIFVDQFSPYLLNTHPAYLPEFPGAHAVADALAAGVKKTGATIMVVDKGVDTGPIIKQKRVRVRKYDTQDTLHERIKKVERKLIIKTVKQIATGKLDLNKYA